jgi:hypothetical protein
MVTYVTTDPTGRWAGTGSPILPAQVDENFYEVRNAIDTLVLQEPVSIQSITTAGTTMTIELTDNSIQTVDLPTAIYTQRNAWQPSTQYATNDTFWNGTDVFFVNYPHISGSTFNPTMLDTNGRPVYTRIFSVPSDLPAGGLKGTVLCKRSTADNDAEWRNSLELPVAAIKQVSGAVTLNKSLGECQRLSVIGNVTSLAISNFGVVGQCSKLVLEVWNTGAFSFAFPTGTIWPGGTAPNLTSGVGKKDVFILLTMDGGATIYGNIVGQDYA